MLLLLWFVFAALVLAGAGYDEVRAWLARPFNTTADAAPDHLAFWHAQLGVQVIIEDYVHHEAAKLAVADAVNCRDLALGLACIVAVLKVSLGS